MGWGPIWVFLGWLETGARSEKWNIFVMDLGWRTYLLFPGEARVGSRGKIMKSSAVE